MWLKTTRITLLVAVLLAVAIVAYLAGHPQLYAGHVGRLVTRHLLRENGWTFACRDLAGNPLQSMRFYEVSMTHDAADGGFSYISCDSLEVEYDLGAILRRNLLLPRIAVYQPQFTIRRVESASEENGGGRFEGPSMPVHLEEIFVYRAALDLQQAGQSETERFDDLNLAASVHSEGNSLRFDLRNLSGSWPSREIDECRVMAEANLTPDGLRVEGATVQLDSMNASVDLMFHFAKEGDWELDITGDAHAFELAPVMELAGKPTDLDLVATGSASLGLGPERFLLDATGEGVLAGYPFRAERAEMHRDGDVLRFDELRGEFLGAHGNVRGTMDPDAMILRLAGRAERVDLSRPWVPDQGPWPASDLAGEFSMQLDLSNGGVFDLDAPVLTGWIEGVEFDSLAVQLSASSEGTQLQRLDAWLYGTKLEASGSVNAEAVADLALRGRAPSAGRLLERFALPGRAFGIEAVGTLRGPMSDPNLSVGAEIDTLGHTTLRGAANVLQIDVAQLLSSRETQVVWRAEELTLGEQQFGRLDANLDWRDGRLAVESLQLAAGDTTLSAAGELRKLPEGPVQLDLGELAVQLGENAWRSSEASRFHLEPRKWSTDGFALISDQGSIQVGGGVDLDAEVDLSVAIRQGQLELLSWAGLIPVDLAGQVAASLRLRGEAAAPDMELELEVDDLHVGDEFMQRLELSMSSEGAALRVEEFELRSQAGNVRLEGTGHLESSSWLSDFLDDPGALQTQLVGARLDVRLDANDLDVAHWLADFPPDARVDLHSSWTGSADSPRVEGSAVLREYDTATLYLPQLLTDFTADRDGIHLRNGRMELFDPWMGFSGRVPLRIRATGAPERLDTNDLQLRIHTTGPTGLAPVATLVDAIEAVEGEFELDFRAAGSLDQPVLSGSLEATGSHLKVAEMLEEFRELRLEGDFREQAFEIGRATAREGEKGRVEIRGSVPFRQLVPDDLQLTVELHRILLLSVPELRAIVSSNAPLRLELTRPLPAGPRVPILRGSVLVDRAIYKGEFTGGEPSGALAATSTPPWMAELEIQLRDQVRISNSVAELGLTGDVDFTRDLSGLRLRGLAEISSGKVTIARLLDFDITEGRLDFSRGTVLEPAVEITAETEVPVLLGQGGGRELELVRVRVRGTFSEPQLSFESETGYDEKTIIKLLAGIPLDSGADQAQFQNLALRMAGNELGRGLAEAFEGIDTVQLETAQPGADPVTGTRIGVGKYVDLADKPLYLRYSQGLSISERDILLEYQLRRRFLVTFEMRRRLRESVAHTSLNADLKFRVEY